MLLACPPLCASSAAAIAETDSTPQDHQHFSMKPIVQLHSLDAGELDGHLLPALQVLSQHHKPKAALVDVLDLAVARVPLQGVRRSRLRHGAAAQEGGRAQGMQGGGDGLAGWAGKRPPLPPPRWLGAVGRAGGIRIATGAAGAAQGAHRRPASRGPEPFASRWGQLPPWSAALGPAISPVSVLGPRGRRADACVQTTRLFGWDARANAGGQLPKRSDCWRLLATGGKRLRALDACCGSASALMAHGGAVEQLCKQSFRFASFGHPLAVLTRSVSLRPASFRAKGALPGRLPPFAQAWTRVQVIKIVMKQRRPPQPSLHAAAAAALPPPNRLPPRYLPACRSCHKVHNLCKLGDSLAQQQRQLRSTRSSSERR